MSEHFLLRHRDIPDIHRLEVYCQQGGFAAFRKAVTSLQPAEIIELVKASGLRGRGGAGFPIGQKWAFLDPTHWPHYLIANADESEPGTFKDRELLERNPFQFLEGVALAAYAIQARCAYIYLRGEFWQLAQQLDGHIAALESAGLLGEQLFGSDYSLHIYTHLGAGAYICGEETALIESIEGKLGRPRLRPPFPPTHGLYGKPTAVNNVETLTNVPLIVNRGAAWYRSFGTEKSPGLKIFALSGCVQRPGNYELPLGTPFRELLFTHGGGPRPGRSLRAILPGGASSCLLSAEDCVLDTPMDYESVAQCGAQLGSASVIAIDDSVDLRWVLGKTLAFFNHESCGKCPPCRLGLTQMRAILSGECAEEGEPPDWATLEKLARIVQRASFCGLGQAAPNAVLAALSRMNSAAGTESLASNSFDAAAR